METALNIDNIDGHRKTVLDRIALAGTEGKRAHQLVAELGYTDIDVACLLHLLVRDGKVAKAESGAYQALPLKKEIVFGEVKPGQAFEFHLPFLAGRAVKSARGMVTCQDGSALSLNLVILEVFSSPGQSSPRKPGEYDWLPDDRPVLVCLE